MRIAQVAPLYESVPPKLYGGTERVVSYLTEELVRQGHDVTLFASGDSSTRARLVASCPTALRLDARGGDVVARHLLLLEQVWQCAASFDLIHYHIDYLHFPCSRRIAVPHLTTLHGRLDIPGLVPLYQEFGDMPVVSISDDQRSPLPMAHWQGTVYHGLPEDLYTFQETAGNYLVFVGRLSPEKQPDHAIEIARRSGLRLKIAAKVDAADQAYFETTIAPLLEHDHVEFIGEVNEREKNELLGHAYALLFPIEWPEPFGLVMIEAMACGTPVVAYRRGSVPEVLEDGVTGVVCQGLDDAVSAIPRIAHLSRRDCRRVFLERFSAARMAHDYAAIYKRLLRDSAQANRGREVGQR
jgi:glycosyltransferase involved in cell wall biosynthesis